MVTLAKVLVVDGSETFRQLMQVLLSPYAGRVLAARGLREACACIAEHADTSLVLSDVRLPDGDGFAILARVRELAEPRPRVLLLSTHPNPGDEQRAGALGALGYLCKPITLTDIRRACKAGSLIPRHPPVRATRRSVGTALLIDGGAERDASLCFEIRDLSVSGAFLATHGPVPVGTELRLALILDGESLDVRARVVRIQEPSWANEAGVGVRFDGLPDAARRWLAARIEGGGRLD
jgi:CheY-like chemotaxis protein